MELRPVAFVCVSDRACRARIISTLWRQGWRTLELPTGFHVVQELADVITGQAPQNRPGLVVIDAIASGCTGTSIAEGLRDLGARIPVVLVTKECSTASDAEIITVDPKLATHVIGELARAHSPVGMSRQRAVA
jgi:FixJ family two-component response regulator